jgi:hypothetical protein
VVTRYPDYCGSRNEVQHNKTNILLTSAGLSVKQDPCHEFEHELPGTQNGTPCPGFGSLNGRLVSCPSAATRGLPCCRLTSASRCYIAQIPPADPIMSPILFKHRGPREPPQTQGIDLACRVASMQRKIGTYGVRIDTPVSIVQHTSDCGSISRPAAGPATTSSYHGNNWSLVINRPFPLRLPGLVLVQTEQLSPPAGGKVLWEVGGPSVLVRRCKSWEG